MIDRDELCCLLPRLNAYCAYLTRHHEDADDLCQDAVERALANEHLFEDGTNLYAWITTIARHKFFTQRRRAWRDLSGEVDDFFWSRQGYEQDFDSRLDLMDTMDAMRQLSDTHCETLARVAFLGQNYEEVAEAMEVPIGTVKSRACRARRRLLGREP